MARRLSSYLSFALSGIVALSFATAEVSVPLPDAQRTNGEQTLKALDWLGKATSGSLVQVLGTNGQLILRGAIVSNDGYFVTKASEAPAQGTFKVAWPDGTQCEARTIRIDSGLDLLLAHAPKTTGIPVVWKTTETLTCGDWIAAATSPREDNGCPLRLGVASARRRSVKDNGVAMGIKMEDTAADKGVLIVEVATTSPAEAAGLREDDLLLALDAQHAVWQLFNHGRGKAERDLFVARDIPGAREGRGGIG